MFQGLLTDFKVTEPEKYKVWHVGGISLFIIFPVCLLRSVNKLRYGTLISIGAIAYSSIVLFVELFLYWDSEKISREIEYFRFDANFFSAFGITFFAFYCQVSFFPSLENVSKLDEPHIKRVILSFNQ